MTRQLGSRVLERLILVSVLQWLAAAQFSTPGFGSFSRSSGEPLSGAAVPHEWVVTFRAYTPNAEHSAQLKQALVGLEPAAKWEVLDRRNPGWLLPSDFALLKIHGDRQDQIALADQLRQHPSVRRVVPHRVIKRPPVEHDAADAQSASRKLCGEDQLVSKIGSKRVWERSPARGAGIKIGIMDTGVDEHHRHFKHIAERTEWTSDGRLEDTIGHGSFVAGVIGSSKSCLGSAPEVLIHTFRVFTSAQMSYTTWFLDAFNYALHTKMDVINLSIGGPDFLDAPFVDKVNEMTSNGIVYISAMGNDGPMWGTLMSPADQMDVIGIGGIDWHDRLASFSARGMTLWEMPSGYGRFKPDIVTHGASVTGSSMRGGCTHLSGTSVASPVVAGAVALLASVVPREKRADLVNPASIKQVLVESAVRLPYMNVFEQGAGKLDVNRAFDAISSFEPKASLLPSELHLEAAPYMWPYSSQPLYAGAIPIMLNATIVNSMGVVGRVVEGPSVLAGDNSEHLELRFEHPALLWPYCGFLAIYVTVPESSSSFEGLASATIEFTVESPAEPGRHGVRRSKVSVPFSAKIIPTPAREKRVLWDQFHNVPYPPGYIPRDNLAQGGDMLDMYGDHPHTNFRGWYARLRSLGYFVEVLGQPFTCFDATKYGTLFIVDSEDLFAPAEVHKLQDDVNNKGLSLVVIAEWYDHQVMKSVAFNDDNTRSLWHALTGGAHVPALNTLLAPWGMAFGMACLKGHFRISGLNVNANIASGTSIARFPAGGYLVDARLSAHHGGRQAKHPVLGMFQTKGAGGRIALFGDASCLDDHRRQGPDCFWLLDVLMSFTDKKTLDASVANQAKGALSSDFNDGKQLPEVHAQPDPILAHSNSMKHSSCTWFGASSSPAVLPAGGSVKVPPPPPTPTPAVAPIETPPATEDEHIDPPSPRVPVSPPAHKPPLVAKPPRASAELTELEQQIRSQELKTKRLRREVGNTRGLHHPHPPLVDKSGILIKPVKITKAEHSGEMIKDFWVVACCVGLVVVGMIWMFSRCRRRRKRNSLAL